MALDALSCVVNIFGCGSCLSPTCDPHVGSRRHDDAPVVALEEHLLPPSSFTMSSEATNSELQPCNSAEPPSEDGSSSVASSGRKMSSQLSWNSTISRMRETSPFFTVQRGGIELRPANQNLLLGQWVMQDRSKFVAAHPGMAVRRPASPPSLR